MSTTSAFQIFSSLRYDPALPAETEQPATAYPDPRESPYYLLQYHRDRLLNAAREFRWDQAIEFLQQDAGPLARLLDTHIPDTSKAWRLRIVVDCNGVCVVEVHPTAPMPPSNLLVPIPSLPHRLSSPDDIWRVYVDSASTVPSEFTTHKTTARDGYTAARQRTGIDSPAELAEVLMVNPEGEIMEGSITTPYFLARNSGSGQESEVGLTPRWITPPLASGGNAGTTRRYALKNGFCTEHRILASELVDGEPCWLSNGVRGFLQGVIVLKDHHK
ncbi:hypothetical protein ASPZODRAFT_130876 [Penicilliopsis zonata CBS 506.65]|uniref:Aminodeoxychorismate lyase n=1 Tax=Penicilliopsis zonata CBS 506.65 TaxID=1073090 RepID=A0A1L9SNI7_9EURO|nr:hypothetical protein ASPZODRAFT_130876 [Penicilliopsis zonata CBS 506.65]OJJ48758.1 hypothetical protein ASPZODRAFT_130876 [Penicilliopsis zonata CBS 506.65]